MGSDRACPFTLWRGDGKYSWCLMQNCMAFVISTEDKCSICEVNPHHPEYMGHGYCALILKGVSHESSHT